MTTVWCCSTLLTLGHSLLPMRLVDSVWIFNFLAKNSEHESYLSTVTTGPPPRAWCSSSATLTRSKTVESGEHCWGQLGLRKIQTSRGFPKEVEWEVETLNIRTLSITWRGKTFQSTQNIEYWIHYAGDPKVVWKDFFLLYYTKIGQRRLQR